LFRDRPLIPLIALLAVLVAILELARPGIVTADWLGVTLRAAVPLAILAGCQTLAMLTGGIDFSGGFSGAASVLTLNGSSALSGTKLRLTDGGSLEAASAFSTSRVDVSHFNTQFNFQVLNTTNPSADGFTFAIQGNAPTAIGVRGSGLGYGAEAAGGSGGGCGRYCRVDAWRSPWLGGRAGLERGPHIPEGNPIAGAQLPRPHAKCHLTIEISRGDLTCRGRVNGKPKPATRGDRHGSLRASTRG
jgi:hypothetical protein